MRETSPAFKPASTCGQPLHLDGIDASVRRLRLFLPRDPVGQFHPHCYQYQPGRSTWVIETDPGDFARAGLGDLGEEESARSSKACSPRNSRATSSSPTARCGAISRPSAANAGPPTTSCCSAMPKRPRISPSARAPSSRWRTRSRSIQSFRAAGGRNVKAALEHFERARREEVEKTQHSADVSLVWFEQSTLLVDGPDALRLRPDDAFQGHHLRQSRAAGAGIRQAGRPAGGARYARARLRRRHRKPGRRRHSSRSGCAA